MAQPQRLTAGSLDLESHLEDWIVRDPSLIEDGFVVVARQLPLDGGPLDLLCLDAQGGLQVVELKRGGLHRDTVAQAIDYAASISSMAAEQLLEGINGYLAKHPNEAAGERLREQAQLDVPQDGRREVGIVLVGTRRDAGLERVADFLGGGYGIPIRVVTLQVLDLGGGDQLLLREASDSVAPEAPRGAAKYTWEGVLANAETAGVGDQMIAVREMAHRVGLYPRPWKVSLMLTPQEDKRRYLFTFWPKKSRPGEIGMDFSPTALSDFFGIPETRAHEVLGGETRVSLTPSAFQQVIESVEALLVAATAEQEAAPGPPSPSNPS